MGVVGAGVVGVGGGVVGVVRVVGVLGVVGVVGVVGVGVGVKSVLLEVPIVIVPTVGLYY